MIVSKSRSRSTAVQHHQIRDRRLFRFGKMPKAVILDFSRVHEMVTVVRRGYNTREENEYR